MPAPPRRRTAVALGGLSLLAAAVLYHFPPAEYGFYPGCAFRAATGLHCPGCGATRCVHALLHGDLPQALAYHPLLVLALPALAVVALRLLAAAWTGRRSAARPLPRWCVYVLVGVLVAFGVLRNVPVYPLTLLAPHALEPPPPQAPG